MHKDRFGVSIYGCVLALGLVTTMAGCDLEHVTVEVPVGTDLIAVRDRVRATKVEHPDAKIEVVLAAGRHVLTQPLQLGPEDSDVVWRGAAGAEVRLAGGKIVDNGELLTNPELLKLLPKNAHGKVRVWDLPKFGIAEIGDRRFNYEHDMQRLAHLTYNQHEAVLDSFPPPKGDKSGGVIEMFANDRPLTVAYGPKDGHVFIDRALGKTRRGHFSPAKMRMAEPVFSYQGDYPDKWDGEPDPWLRGSWACDWGEQTQKVLKHDVKAKVFELSHPAHYNGYSDGYWFVGENMLSELDAEGQYVIDGNAKKIYAWVPDGAKVEFSMASRIVEVVGATNVTIRSLILETARNSAVKIENSENVRVEKCDIRNCGGYGVLIKDGRNCGVGGCDLHDLGQGGVFMFDGNRKTLEVSGHYTDNCHIHDFGRRRRMYRPAIWMLGVGQRATHNLIHNAPHSAILFFGNEMEIAWNDIHDVCYASNDCGALYTGRSWTLRGNRIHHNYFHHIIGLYGRTCNCIYLDDSSGCKEIADNVFEQTSWSVFLGGARDTLVARNVFIDSPGAIHYDARGMGWQHSHIENERLREWKRSKTMNGVEVTKPPYSERYPELAKIPDDHPYEPMGNLITSNVFWQGSGEFIRYVSNGKKPYSPWYKCVGDAKYFDPQFKDNFADVDPKTIGWQGVDPKIGLYASKDRYSWPVEHQLRQLPKVVPRAAMRQPEKLGAAQLRCTMKDGSKKIFRVIGEKRPDGAYRIRVHKGLLPKDVKSFDVISEAAIQPRTKRTDTWFMLCDGRWGWLNRTSGRTDLKSAYDTYDRTGLFGMKLKDGAAWCGIIKGMRCESRTEVEAANGYYTLYTRFDLGEIGFGLYEDVVIDFYALSGKDANYSAMGRLYRKYQLEECGCVPLKERVQGNPALKYETESMFVRYKFGRCDRTKSGPEDWLKAMPPVVVDHTFADYCDFMKRCKAAGMDKLSQCMVGFQYGGHDGPFPDLFPADARFGGEKGMREAIALGKSLGYRMSVHINQHNFYLNAKRYCEADVAKDRNGEIYKYTVYPGGQVYHSCFEQICRRYMDKDLADMKDLGLDGLLHVDVTTAKVPTQCWDKTHPNNRANMRDWQVRCAEKARAAFGGFSSESGFDHIAKVTDNILYVTPYPGWQSPKDDLIDGIFPVWQIAYNGIIMSNPFYATIDAPCTRGGSGKTDAVGKNSAVTMYLDNPDNRMLKVFELGGRPMFYYSDYSDLAPLKRMYDAWQPLKHLQFEFIEEHVKLAKGVFVTRYGNGEEVVCNYTDKPYKHRGESVAPHGYHLYAANNK